MTELTDLSETDASNINISGANIAEGCAPSEINNAIRNLAGLIRRAFKASIFRLRDSTDQTKLLAFDLSALTSGTTTIVVGAGGTLATSGQIVSSIGYAYSTYSSTSAQIPTDDTKPQITEGDPVFSQNYTPKSATNKIRVRASIPCTASGLDNVTAALFVASGADAVQVDWNTIPSANYFHTLNLEHEFTAGTTSPINIQVRVGPGSGTMYLNGTTTARRFGGALAATMVIEEIKG